MYKKIIAIENYDGSDVLPNMREKILAGVRVVNKAVGMSLGPSGRNAIIHKKYKAPVITNDGVTIARHIVLNDEIEDLGAQTLVEAAMKTNDTAGDGTTTSIVIAAAIVEKCFKKLMANAFVNGKEAIEMSREIKKAKDIVIEKIKSVSRPLEEGDIENIITTSLENPEFGKALAEMVKEIGKDGKITVDYNWTTRYGIETEVIKGMRFLGTYATHFMCTNAKKEAIWTDTPILLCNRNIEATNTIKKVVEDLQKQNKTKLVIITENYSKPFILALAQAIQNARQGNSNAIQILAIKAPSLTTEEFRDISYFIGGKFFDKNAGQEPQDADFSNLGYAEQVLVDEDNVVIMGGKGGKERVDQRIAELTTEMILQKDAMFQEKLRNRIASISSGIGIIRVGAPTQGEQEYLLLKIEDAVNAAKATMEEGVVKGGGLCLKEIAEELGIDHILYEALMAPYNTIQDNAGGIIIADTILDPAKVTRLALENACSAAGTLITTEVALAEHNKTLLEEMKMAFVPEDNTDYRHEQNMDKGRGRIVE